MFLFVTKLRALIEFFFDSVRFNFNSRRNYVLLRRNTKLTYGDQKGQVDYLINNVLNYEKNGLKRNGFFIDLACADGMYINNTYFLEKHLNWDGLLFEPNPRYTKKVLKHRKAKLVTKCVTDTVGDVVKFRIDNGMLGGIVSLEADNNEKNRARELKQADIIEIETTTLEHELDKVNAPKIIDFMSLDIEGAEWIALRNFPFDKYKFKCMTVERPNIELDLLLEDAGYRQVAHLNYDVIYVHSSFISDVNYQPNIRFLFTPGKNW